MFKFININIKNVFDELKLDIKFIFNEIIHIPSMNALKRKYKDYNPVSKFFTPFMYINPSHFTTVLITYSMCNLTFLWTNESIAKAFAKKVL